MSCNIHLTTALIVEHLNNTLKNTTERKYLYIPNKDQQIGLFNSPIISLLINE